MSFHIISKDKRSMKDRMASERNAAILKHYYGREIRDGSRFKTNGGFSKKAINRVYKQGDGTS